MQYMQKKTAERIVQEHVNGKAFYMQVWLFIKDGELDQDGLEPRIVSPSGMHQAIVEVIWY